MNANEVQVGGDHYKSSLQHWDFVSQALCGCYLEGCITKYVSRWRKKNGKQDLQKAAHYLDKLYQEYLVHRCCSMKENQPDVISALALAGEFCVANNLDFVEEQIMINMVRWDSGEDLLEIKRLVNKLLEQ